METAIQILAVINLSVIGVSHVVRPRAWVALFHWLRSKGEAGVLVVAFFSLGFGSIIAAFHNVWSGLPVVLTLLGWAHVTKAFLYFTWPTFGLKKLRFVTEERAKFLILPGMVFLLIAVLLLYELLRTSPAT
ncbi:MAG: hypothetical protein AAF916_05920 [Planctomycetota bacterium]